MFWTENIALENTFWTRKCYGKRKWNGYRDKQNHKNKFDSSIVYRKN